VELAKADYPANMDTRCVDRFKSDNGCKCYGPYLCKMLAVPRIANQSIKNADTIALVVLLCLLVAETPWDFIAGVATSLLASPRWALKARSDPRGYNLNPKSLDTHGVTRQESSLRVAPQQRVFELD
jgi:hypothetical protein